MQIFFSTLPQLESFTRLKTLPKENACQHCKRNDQWLSHGYVYKQHSSQQRDIIGKRILCGRRFGQLGCGRTRQLYLDQYVPQRHYSLAVLIAFARLLLSGVGVQQAYRQALGEPHKDPRQAWRWLEALYFQLGFFRSYLGKVSQLSIEFIGRQALQYPSRRRNILHSTIKNLLSLASDSDNATLQTLLQTRFF